MIETPKANAIVHDSNNPSEKGSKVVQDEVLFYGHPNIQSLHSKSIEITKDSYLTPRGDCILGINANKACADLEEPIRRGLKSSSAVVKIEVIVGDESFVIKGRGDERLTILNSHDIVIRRTKFVCPRTMSVLCDKASSDVPRELIGLLRHQEQKGIFRITLE